MIIEIFEFREIVTRYLHKTLIRFNTRHSSLTQARTYLIYEAIPIYILELLCLSYFASAHAAKVSRL